jgi:predicted anti-sigma-YlaC factor YlaD
MSLKPTCREVHRLVSEGLDRDLSLIERARMQMHLLVCRACQNFNSQMSLLRRAMRNFQIPDVPAAPEKDKP